MCSAAGQQPIIYSQEQSSEEEFGMTPQSSDLNISEWFWDDMKRHNDVIKSTSTEDLRFALQDVWNNLPAEYFKTCQPTRTDAVLKAGVVTPNINQYFSFVYSLHFVV